jgi:hypothetical protein
MSNEREIRQRGLRHMAMSRLIIGYRGKVALLEKQGLIVGNRDPQRNTSFEGAFMVAEPISDPSLLPTKHGSRGCYCVVGDDLRLLVNVAFDHFHPTVETGS